MAVAPPADERYSWKAPATEGVASEPTKALLASRVTRAIKPASLHTSARDKPRSLSCTSKSPVRASQAKLH